jgi:3-phenylpropionate/trans-cinnamate dioxygenase ferredoxin reductase subunit
MRDAASTSGETTIVIGAGQAGFSFSARLRELGYLGDIILTGDEHHAPYQRPPLSKAYLLGDMSLDRMLLRPAEFYPEQGIDLRTGTKVTAITPDNKTVTLGDGTHLSYKHLILATGSTPRELPPSLSGGLGGIYYMRSIADADAIEPEFTSGRRALVVGGGYIGLEAAAVAAKRGVKTVLIEAADRILQRVACSQTSDYFRDVHRSHGVDIREGVGLEALHGKDGRVSSATLSDGTSLDIDFVIAGIGILPNVDLAQAAGLDCENGIRVDATCITSDPSILAIGDCACFPRHGDYLRLESVGNAIDQGQLAAANVMGSNEPYVAKPWFWSDQYDIKLQIAGLSTGFDRIIVRQGEAPSRSHWYFAGEDLLAVDAMNDPRAYMVAKRLIEAGKSPPAEAVSDIRLDLKDLLKT